MKRTLRAFALMGLIFGALLMVACTFSPLPPVQVPYFNQAEKAKIELGKKLFFDPNLSNPPGIACASCHDPAFGFSDGQPFSDGVFGRTGDRNAPTIYNAAYNLYQFWDGRSASLEDQVLGPIRNPVEMNNTLDNALNYLRANPEYQKLFQKAFNGEITTTNVAKAIAAYERTIISNNTPYDRYVRGDKKALSEEAKRGMKIFFGKGRCAECHPAPFFTDSDFHNLGVPNNPLKPDVVDKGRYNVTGAADDLGKFKTPTLREIARTYPYMHNGVFQTLEEVVEFYDDGGGTPIVGEKDPDLVPLNLTEQEKKDLVAFLKALTSSN